MNATELLAALEKERQKYTKSDPLVMWEYIDALIACGEYPKELVIVGSAHIHMVENYGVYWHRFKGVLECPHCDVDLRDHKNGPPFKRTIGVYSRALDRTVAWRCPDCNGEWPRQ
jgi:hypothetical protein